MGINVVPLRPTQKSVVSNNFTTSSSVVEIPISLTVSLDWVDGPGISAPRVGNTFAASRVEKYLGEFDHHLSESVQFTGNIDEVKKVIDGSLKIKQYSDGELLFVYQMTFTANRVMRAAHKELGEYVGKAICTKRIRLLNNYKNSSR